MVQRTPGESSEGEDLLDLVLIGVLGVDPVARGEAQGLARCPDALIHGAHEPQLDGLCRSP